MTNQIVVLLDKDYTETRLFLYFISMEEKKENMPSEEIKEMDSNEAMQEEAESSESKEMPEQKDVEPEQTEEKVDSEEKSVEAKSEMKKSESKSIIDKLKGLSWQMKIILFGMPLLILLTLILLITILKLDAYIFPSTLKGQVTSQQGVSLENVEICLQKECVMTDGGGFYSIEGLKYGKNTIKVQLEDYENFSAELSLKRGENIYNIQLNPSGVGNVSGMLTFEDELELTDLVISIDGAEISLEDDYTFSSDNIALGSYEFVISSPSYVDYTLSVDLEEGLNELGEFSLIPAGDVSFTPVDWLSREFINGIKFEAGKYPIVEEDGVVTIKDIVISEVSQITATPDHDDYLDNDILFRGIKQGLNDVGEYGIVREGRIVYTSNRTGNRNVYSSNYDGSDEVLLTGSKGDNYDPYLTSDGKTVYFTSTRDGVKNTYGDVSGLLYSVPVNGGNVTKVTKTEYSENNGYLGGVNYEAGKRFYTTGSYWLGTEKIVISDLDGNNLVDLVTGDDNYGSLYLSDNGKYMLFSISNYDTGSSANGIYRVNVATKGVDAVYLFEDENSAWSVAINNSSTKAMLRVYDDGSNTYDLWLMNIDGTGLAQITDSSASEDYASLSPDGKYASYMSSRDGRTDIYLNSTSTDEVKLTNDGKVTNYFWGSNGLLFYNSEDKLWIVDINNPGKAQVVTENALGPYYYGYYYWD
ncbi:PD40 domain-containing protein [Candidatus Dojkabacteria bacterium]|uniref:PD40 domain-containing protein n=1 Tax=Candidatus Dojkabacteria bacterium TaxID=2099670 RepID=A0A955RIQ7_9BACT|nr:PD40 domain-containing protein [Candidatus Dojkabacteria bacterium]